MLHPLDSRRPAALMTLTGVVLFLIATGWIWFGQIGSETRFMYAVPVLILVGFLMAAFGAYRWFCDRA